VLKPAWGGLSQSSVTPARSYWLRWCRGFLSLTGCSTPGHRRSAAAIEKTFNRLAEHELDAANLRTARRALPTGRLSRRFARALAARP
jgi:heme O synthase-like polyprenyltransferase